MPSIRSRRRPTAPYGNDQRADYAARCYPRHQKWEAILLENCRRFAAGQPLINVVDEEKWY